MAPFRRAAAFAAGLALVLPGLAGAATSASAADKVTSLDPTLTAVNLLNINDFHGRLDGGSLDGLLGKQVACTIESAKTKLGVDKTAFLSAGDNVGASTFASFIANDEPTIAYLNALQLQASAVGNHEFDQGYGDLTGRLMTEGTWGYLAANVYKAGTTTPALPEYKVIQVNGVRVGVIGAITQQTPMMVSPLGVLGLDFGDPVTAVNRVADKLVAGDLADIIVAEYHEGAAASTSLATETAASPVFAHIVNDTSSKVSVIFNGHTHAVYTWDGPAGTGTRSVSESASYGAFVGQLQLGYDPATKAVKQYVATNLDTTAGFGWVTTATPPSVIDTTAQKIAKVDAKCAGDAEYTAAAKIVTDAVANAKVLGSKVIGHVSADITRAYSGGSWVDNLYTSTKPDDRMRESNLGNLEAQVWYEAMNAPDKAGADLGVQNPGGVRTDLKYAASGTEAPGEVTYAEAASVNPFANTLVTTDITGAQLKTLLEQQWQPAGATRAFLNLGLSKNVRYTFDPTKAIGSHVTGIFVNDQPVVATKTYRVATNSFLAGGGDNFFVLASGTNYADSGLIDMDAFINWLSKAGTVSPDFAKQGVAVVGAPASINYGKTTTFTVEGFDMTSLASPHNTSATLSIYDGGKGAYPVSTQLVHLDDPGSAQGLTRNLRVPVRFVRAGTRRVRDRTEPGRLDAKGLDRPRPEVHLGRRGREDDDLALGESAGQCDLEFRVEDQRGGRDRSRVAHGSALPRVEGRRRCGVQAAEPARQGRELRGTDAGGVRAEAVHVDAERAGRRQRRSDAHQHQRPRGRLTVGDERLQDAGADRGARVPGQEAGGQHAASGDALGRPHAQAQRGGEAAGFGDQGVHGAMIGQVASYRPLPERRRPGRGTMKSCEPLRR
jgi:5'-nucleotidase